MMEAISFSETPANMYETKQRNIPEDDHFQNVNRTKFIFSVA
jgi:hypothetical protein